ncbi:MAG: hypothetical protein HeimC2_26610 [Candidatus Heimdallarchaeota archaeon LC_2]|nr:MAG: hypothetical protein HeimC2_26610 [Candidatus Heimdallarchaeota archaeon LC_2]
MTENQQHQAYQLLVEKYMQKPTAEQLELCETLFIDWCQSGNQNLLSHLLEFIGSHESKEIRKLAMKTLRSELPKEKKKDIIDLWINHPSPTLIDYIESIIKSTELPQPLMAATYLMLNKWDLLEELDPDLELIDQYVKDLDPLMGSLLFARINQLKSFERYETTLNSQINFTDEKISNVSILDKIRSKDFEYLWENILQYPFPFICELMKIFAEDKWIPRNASDIEIFETLIEQLGTKGWYNVSDLKWMTVSKKIGSKYNSLTDIEIRNRQFELLISPELINRPDRIQTKKVRIRGHFNLVNPDIDLHIYQKSIRKSDIDGLLHIPIYTNNGVEIAEFMIPAVNSNSFSMDEDGLYFSVRNQSGLYTLDIDALAAILLPVSNHSEAVTEIIPSLKEKSKKSSLSTVNALELLSSLHRGREYRLWDLKQSDEIELELDEMDTCGCVLGIDIGDHITKACVVSGPDCDINFQTWELPSLIHFISLNEFIIGSKVIEDGLENSSQTFRNWIGGLYAGNIKLLRIQNIKISPQIAYEHFISTLVTDLKKEINHNIENLSLTYPMELPLSLHRWIIAQGKKLHFKNITLVDNLTALSLAESKVANQRGNLLMIDIGSSQMSAAVTSINFKKSRKRIEIERIKEKELGQPHVIAKISTKFGSEKITEFLASLNKTKKTDDTKYTDIQLLKHELANKFEGKLVGSTNLKNERTYSLNTETNENVINVKEKFAESDIFSTFKLLIRNVIIKAAQRGVEKSKIDTIFIHGDGAKWPPYLEYLYTNFSDIPLLIESDKAYPALGACLAGSNQSWEFYPERDYLLKLTQEGSTLFETIIRRGEMVSNKYKNFEIRFGARFEHIVLDYWSRFPVFNNEKDKFPMRDTDFQDHRRSDENMFNFDRIHRDLIKVNENTIFSIQISNVGKFTLKLIDEDQENTIDLQTFIH